MRRHMTRGAATPAPAAALRLLVLAAAAAGGSAQAPRSSLRLLQSGPQCHADMLVKNVDFGGLAAYERKMLAPELARLLALQNGLSKEAVMSPTHEPGSVGFFSGSYVAPWAPPNRRPYTQGASTIISALIAGCDEPKATLEIFRTDQMHSKVQAAIKSTIGGSAALAGDPQVLGVAVVPVNGSPPAPAASPAVQAPPVPPTAPAPATPAPGQVLAPQQSHLQVPSLALTGGEASKGWLLPGLGGVCALLLAFGLCVLAVRQMRKKDAREDFDALSDGSELGH